MRSQRRPRPDRDPSAKNFDTVLAQVRNGGGRMPPFKGTLADKEIDDVAAYVVQEITNRR